MNPYRVLLATLIVMGGLSGAALAQSRSTYIVQLAAEPAATYNGNVAGYAATSQQPGNASTHGRPLCWPILPTSTRCS